MVTRRTKLPRLVPQQGTFLFLGAILLAAGIGSGVLSPLKTGQRLTDAEFEQISADLSEEPGQFATDNLVSNESSYLHVREHLRTLVRPGGVYLGVGPGQNFSYIAMNRPVEAYILDIRRDNLLHHLYYKALFERSADRWDYLSYLFGIPVPESVEKPSDADAADLAITFRKLPADLVFFQDNLNQVWHSLLERFPKLLTEEDRESIYRIATKFFTDGLNIRYEIRGRRHLSFFPSFEALMMETDLEGKRGHYLNSEESFQFLKRLQEHNRIILVMGDFGGTKALKAIGARLKSRGLVVSVFYTSNVEFYLLRSRLYRRFVDSVSQLPIDAQSVFVRSYFNHWYGSWRRHPYSEPDYFSTSLVQRIQRFLQLDGLVPYESYWDLATRDYEGDRHSLEREAAYESGRP